MPNKNDYVIMTPEMQFQLNETTQVTIPKKEYDGLLHDSKKLHALENMGVDNWDGYNAIDWDKIFPDEA